MIGLRSTVLHTNGFSLARKVLFPTYNATQHVDELGTTVGEALLAVHRSYLNVCKPLLESDKVLALSHITGGGIVGNTSRVLPDGLTLDIDWNSWKWLPVFKLIQQAGNIAEEEMRHVFNLGIGLIIVCKQEHVDEVLRQTASEHPVVMGMIGKA